MISILMHMWYHLSVLPYIVGSIAEPDARLTNFDLFSCVEVYVLASTELPYKLYLRRHIKIQRWKISFEAGWRVFREPPSNGDKKKQLFQRLFTSVNIFMWCLK